MLKNQTRNDWYSKLREYFPIQELKSKQHIETLLQDKKHVYRKDEGPDHVMLYAEYSDFVFVDYVYVAAEARGKRLGHKLIGKLKEKKKMIVLEVEGVNPEEPDTQKRVRFYQREGFHHAQLIAYRRLSLATRQINEMDVWYWVPPHNEDDEEDFVDRQKRIIQVMKRVYVELHTYRDMELYGDRYPKADKVLTLKPEQIFMWSEDSN